IRGRITSMPGFLTGDQALGMKVVTYFQENPQKDLPAILATILLFSAETGKIVAAMDGSYITAIRTACASALATEALANPRAPVLGILGAGVQARPHSGADSRAQDRVYPALQPVGDERRGDQEGNGNPVELPHRSLRKRRKRRARRRYPGHGHYSQRADRQTAMAEARHAH